jgi:hypothetical protein
MPYEHRSQPLLPPGKFAIRLLNHLWIALGITGVSLGLGTSGYHYIVGLAWVDALLNASMILSGMGPVDAINTNGGKIFASAYALLSGLVFIAIVGVLLAPIMHRVFHRLHIEDK